MKTIRVVAAVIESNGKYLVAQRPFDKELGGQWEFPGGKVEAGESDEEALKREISEELEIEISVLQPLAETSHISNNRIINLHFYSCKKIGGEMSLNEHNAVLWLNRESLLTVGLADGDQEFVLNYI